jgi:phosphatidylethanolamine/phosphatidyl-N-methylethanolamine N-methyltransferase
MRYAPPVSKLDADAVRTAYRRQAAFYDAAFGRISRAARLRAIHAVNALPGPQVLEVGVGTGLALPLYDPRKRVTGIDLSTDMLERARARVEAENLTCVEALLEQDAEATDFAAASFDIAAVMFVASVVPHPRKLFAELRRVVRPGGHILFVNHFVADSGVRRAVEHGLAPLSRALGWHPDFSPHDLFGPNLPPEAIFEPLPPFGLFTLVHLPRLETP